MELGGYKFEVVKRFEPCVDAAFVREKDALLVASPAGAAFELELFDLPKFKRLSRTPVEQIPALKRVGDDALLLVTQGDLKGPSADLYKQQFEVRRLKDFGVTASFVEEDATYVAASPDGSRIAVAHDFGSLNIWDAGTGALIYQHQSKGMGGVAYSHDGELLAAKEFAGTLRIFDAAKPEEGPLRSMPAGRNEPLVAFHPDRHLVAAAGRNAIKLFDADTGKAKASIKTTKRESQSAIHHMDFSPDGKLLATSTLSHGVISLWDVEEAEFIGHLAELNEIPSNVEFDASGKYLLVASYQAAEVYSVEPA